MNRSRKEVDRHVEQLESSIKSEAELSLKALNVSKLYYNVKELDLALKWILKYINHRPNSAVAFRQLGLIHESAMDKDKAMQAYRNAYELDKSGQKELILKACELILPLVKEDKAKYEDKVRYWLKLGEKEFPSHKCVQDLKKASSPANGSNGANNSVVNNSAVEDIEEELNSSHNLWSHNASFSTVLNGSRGTPRVNRLLNQSSSTPNRFPRASPERLEAQVRSVERDQERIMETLTTQNRMVLDEFRALLEEMRLQRQSVVDELKTNRQNVADLKIEMKQGMHEMKVELQRIGQIIQHQEPKPDHEVRRLLAELPANIGKNIVIPQPPPPPVQQPPAPAAPAAKSGVSLQELQEALAQQTTLFQMSNLSLLAQQQAKAAQFAPPNPAHPPPPPPPVQVYQPPPPVQLPQVPVPPPSHAVDKPHDYQIPLNRTGQTPNQSPFKESITNPPDSAVPVSTNALLSNVPSPLYSSLTKTPTTTSSTPPGPTNLMDKFKPKAGSWECSGCMTRNDAAVIQCPACETAKPGHEDEVKKKQEAAKPSVSFGAGGGFKFGFQPTQQQPSGFQFGSAAATAPAAGTSDHLSFENQQLKLNSAQDAKEVCDKILAFKSMKRLTFAGNTVNIDAAGAIGKALEKHPEFERAHWKDMFTGRMKTEIPPALKHLSKGILTAKAHLVELDLSDNAFGPVGMEGIIDLLKSDSCSTLKELKLNNTGCGVTGGRLLADALTANRKMKLKVFILGRSRQENEGAKALAKVFKSMGTLEEVIMPQNGIYHEGIAALSDAFSANPNLKTLNMNDNTFTEVGAKSLAKALPKLTKLEYLNLGDCLLKTEGANMIMDALKSDALEEVHLDSNEIKVEGGMKIAETMIKKPKLKKLYIGTNCFGSEGCERIIAMLEAAGKMELLPEGEIEDDEGDEDDEDDDGDYSDVSTNDAEEENENDEGDGLKITPVPFKSGPTNDDNSVSASATFGTAIFGGGSGSTPAENTPIFGKPVFGGNANSSAQNESSIGKSIFGTSTNTPSFGSLASNSASTFAFGQKSDKPFSFQGAGAAIFNTSTPSSAKQDDSVNEGDGEDAPEHDPHFEPIIPLPELVQVTTGEEDEEEVYKHRSKVFRFDPDTKQWKERGVGDLKILKHPSKGTYRVLLRRDQTLKIACNHLITTEMKLEPMFGSENATTWFAMDYADEEGKTEKLAAKFKTAEIKNDFKKKFEECQAALGSGSSPNKSVQNIGGNKNDSVSVPAKETPSNVSAPIFGGGSGNAGESNIGKAIFGGASSNTNTEASSIGKPIFGTSSNTPSFGSLASNTTSSTFAFGQKSDKPFSFQGAGAAIFNTSATSPAKKDESTNDGDAEDAEHDPHFEPIIPLPELVQVTTGEEDEEEVYKHRSKVFRFDPDSKQWKERGVGDLKILKHPTKGTYRVLLRRDQTLKIACNHLINKEMKLEPMFGSENATTWFAMDYADEEGKMEKLAAKFKTAEIKNDFKKKFEECQAALGSAPPAGEQNDFVNNNEDGDDEEEDEDDEEENVMYDRECELKDKDSGSLGRVVLRIVYDDDVYGARIIACPINSSDEDTVCNHLIAIQTELKSTQLSCSWSALDFSRDPPAYRGFEAVFDLEADMSEFKETFSEGKELADQSEILELPQNQREDAYYYGEGAEHDDD